MNNKAMSVALNNAASGYAEKMAREQGLTKITCSSVDYAVRRFAFDLVNAGVVGADEMYDFLYDRRYRDYTPEVWWND